MLTAAFIVGWNVQMYRCSPGRLATYFQLLPGAIDFESNAPSAAVAECGNGSLFTHTTVSALEALDSASLPASMSTRRRMRLQRFSWRFS
jgi:hypothetical protein